MIPFIVVALIAIVVLAYTAAPGWLWTLFGALFLYRLSAANDHRVEKQMTFVDEIGFERKPRKLCAANADVVLRFRLSLRIASRSKFRSTRVLRVATAVSVRENTIFSAFCQTCAKSRCSGG